MMPCINDAYLPIILDNPLAMSGVDFESTKVTEFDPVMVIDCISVKNVQKY